MLHRCISCTLHLTYQGRQAANAVQAPFPGTNYRKKQQILVLLACTKVGLGAQAAVTALAMPSGRLCCWSDGRVGCWPGAEWCWRACEMDTA